MKTPLWKSRTLMAFIAIAIMWALWERFCWFLWHMPSDRGAFLVSVTQTICWTISLLCASLAGIKSLEKIFEFKNAAISDVVSTVATEITHIERPRNHDDGTLP